MEKVTDEQYHMAARAEAMDRAHSRPGQAP
jgi:hypothetical protein